jgi:hypothetical protein
MQAIPIVNAVIICPDRKSIERRAFPREIDRLQGASIVHCLDCHAGQSGELFAPVRALEPAAPGRLEHRN